MKKIAAVAMFLVFAATLFTGCAQSGEFNKDQKITVVSREDGSGTRGAFIELFGIEVKGEDGSKKDMTTKDALVVSKTDVMLTNIAGDPYALGYVSLGSLNDTIKALDIDGVKATTENVKNGTYKISRPFNIATKGEPTGLAKDFIGYILSKEGQEIIATNHYIAIDDAAPAYAGGAPSGKITVAGSSSVTPVMEKLQEAYQKMNPGATIEIQMSDSTAGMTGAIDGTCEIGMASRGLKDAELEQLTPISIALDGIAVIVNVKNPLTTMTKDEVKGVYISEKTRWSELVK